MPLAQKKIADLVEENFVYASVLYYLGIRFFDYSRETLGQVCAEKGLDLLQVTKNLEQAAQPQKDNKGVALTSLPIDVVVEYLKHAHHVFIKDRLHYITRLVEHLPDGSNPAIADLKFVFPLFVEDFIVHVYEEEDTLFDYVLKLNSLCHGELRNPGIIHHHMQRFSLQEFVMEHEIHDDEMAGIRQITQDYAVSESTPLHLRIVYAELQSFEQELITHAGIENNILFPKALSLEKQAKDLLLSTSKLN